MTLNANWAYPTSIKFGAGRIKEIAEACRAVGMKNPLFVTDRRLATTDIAKKTLSTSSHCIEKLMSSSRNKFVLLHLQCIE